MKKIITFVLAITFILATVGNTTVFAADKNQPELYDIRSEENNGIMPLASDSYSGEMNASYMVSFQTRNIGTSPTFTFSITGNPRLNVKVTAVTPGGTHITLFDSVPANGTVKSTRITTFVSGTFTIYISPASGSSAGEMKYWKMDVSW